MRRLIATAIWLFFYTGINAQKDDPIASIRLGADSVWVLSHSVTEVFLTDESSGSIRQIKLGSDGKLDSSLIIETAVLRKSDRMQLASLLARPNTERKIEMAKCFMPRHAIVWSKGGKLSWIEICFSCQQMGESGDISVGIPDIDHPKWKVLRLFFRKKGLKYSLE